MPWELWIYVIDLAHLVTLYIVHDIASHSWATCMSVGVPTLVLDGGLRRVGWDVLRSRTVTCIRKLVSGIASRARHSLG